ncbi:2918_t:CDS:1, partial [Racocetra persica]
KHLSVDLENIDTNQQKQSNSMDKIDIEELFSEEILLNTTNAKESKEINSPIPIEKDQDSSIDEVINDISNEALTIESLTTDPFIEIEEPKSQSTS